MPAEPPESRFDTAQPLGAAEARDRKEGVEQEIAEPQDHPGIVGDPALEDKVRVSFRSCMDGLYWQGDSASLLRPWRYPNSS
jgi:hypothetical protein